MKKILFIFCILISFISCKPNKTDLFKACATNDLATVEKYYKNFTDEISNTELGTDLTEKIANWLYYKFDSSLDYSSLIDANSSPFKIAVLTQSLDVMNYFIENGFDINLKSEESDRTFLMFSLDLCLSNSTELLLEKGAEINVFDGSGYSTLWHAITANNRVDTVEALLIRGANPNLRNNNEDEKFPLLFVVEDEKTEYFNLLLKYGANINETDKNGNSLLIIAVKNKMQNKYSKNIKEILSVLLDKKVQIDFKGQFGMAALHWACSNGNQEIVNLLLQHKANVNIKDEDGDTALIRAANNGHSEIVSLLIKNGANINTQNNDGKTALMRACEFSSFESVKVLLDNKANKNLRNKKGKTAFQVIGERNSSSYAMKEVQKELLGLNSYEEWTPARFNMQKDKNIGKRIVFKSLLIGDINTDHTVYLMDTDVRDFVHNVYYNSYDRDSGVDLEEKLLDLATKKKNTVANCGDLRNATADYYGYIGTIIRWGSQEAVFHITHILETE